MKFKPTLKKGIRFNMADFFVHPDLIAPKWREGDLTIAVSYEQFIVVFWNDGRSDGLSKDDLYKPEDEMYSLLEKIEKTPKLITKEDADRFWEIYNSETYPYTVSFE